MRGERRRREEAARKTEEQQREARRRIEATEEGKEVGVNGSVSSRDHPKNLEGTRCQFARSVVTELLLPSSV